MREAGAESCPISGLKKERDEARALSAQAEGQIPMSNAATATILSYGKRASEDDEIDPSGKTIRSGIPSNIISELIECNTALSQQRKKQQIPTTLAPVDAVERYTQTTLNPLHRTNKPGILAMDILYSKDIIATT